MSPFDLFSVRFALASAACLAAGLGVWGVTTLARRVLPAFAMQRSGWLLAQCAIAATFVLLLLPQTEQLRMVPAIELAEPHADVVHAATAPTARQPAPALPSARSRLLDAAHAWLLIYLAGLGFALWRLIQGQRIVARLARSGTLLARSESHPGWQGRPAPVPTIEVAAAISPMLVGLFRPRLLLPLHLRSFDPVQQQLIIEHELTHWRRGDLRWMTAALVLQTLFWFHPVMRLLRARLSWAQELACDSTVLQGRALVQRKAYAAALLAQLKLQHLPVHMTLAFGGVGADTLAARMALIRSPRQAARGAWTRAIVLSGLAAVFIGNLALQPALAWHRDAPTDIDCTAMVDARTGTPLLRQGDCSQRVTPASTFNIVVSLMGFDSGILRDAHTPLLPFKQGYIDWNDNWRQATDPTSWIRNSTVWYAQQVTTQLGATRLAQYLARFDYGNRDASGDPGQDNGVTASWIGSSMQISPDEQTAFLRKIVNRELPVNPHAFDITAQLLQLPQLPEAAGWQVYGKTGTASPLLANGNEDNAHQYGWFVGWATKGDRTVVFARLLLDKKEADSAAGPRVKAAFLRALPARLAAL
jgi:beta-lactamase class D/beta-lactamase regulating signal transducer with metallopeptidase domain